MGVNQEKLYFSPKGSKRSVFLLIVLLFILIGGGAFLYLKERQMNSSNNDLTVATDSEVKSSVPTSASGATGQKLDGNVSFNIESVFNQSVEVLGVTTFKNDINAIGRTMDLGSGKIFASNVLNGVTPGAGIAVSGDEKTPTLINTGVTSLQGRSGSVEFQPGSGISINGLTISVNQNSLPFFNLSAGNGIQVNKDTQNKTITISSNTGWMTDANGVIQPIDLNSKVGIGTIPSSAYKLDVNGNVNITGSISQNSSPSFLLPQGQVLGSAVYWDGTAWIENSSIIYDAANNRVSIGSANPNAALDVSGNIRLGDTGVNNILNTGSTPGAPSGPLYWGNRQICDTSDNCNTGGSISGTPNYIPKYGTSTTLTDSQIYDSGTYVGIGTLSPTSKLDVAGDIQSSNDVIAQNGFCIGTSCISSWSAVGLSVAWGEITGTLSDQADLQTALDAKQNNIAVGTTSQYYRGDKTWQTLDTSIVTENTNLYFTQSRFDTAFATKTTTSLVEGSNLYFTDARVRAAITVSGSLNFNTTTGVLSISQANTLTDGYLSAADYVRFDAASAGELPSGGNSTQYLRGDRTWQSLTSSVVPEGTNLYYTSGRFNTDFATKTTTDLTEGTNLYYTNARARSALSANGPLSYNTATGNFSIAQSSNSTDGYLSATDYARFDSAVTGELPAGGTSAQYLRGDATWQVLNTSIVPESTNLYYTTARFNTDFATKSTTDLPEGTNKYFTDTRARAALSATAPLSYNSSTGSFSIPQSNGTTDGYLSSTDWARFDAAAGAGTGVGGSGTANYIPKFSASTTLGNSIIYDNGTNIGVGTITPGYALDVNGDIYSNGYVRGGTGLCIGANCITSWTSAGISVNWGDITGTLSDQTDLQNALNAKEGTITAGTTAQYYRGDKTWQTLNTTIVPEGTNLYYTSSRFNTDFAGKTTTDLAEGTNEYFTTTRARSVLSATLPLNYNTATGYFSITQADASNDGYLTAADWARFDLAAGGGSISGTGSANRVAFWTGTTALSSSVNLYWDNANSRLGINNASPSASLDVIGDTNISGQITGTGGMVLGTELGSYVPGSHLVQINATGTVSPLMISGGAGNVQIWKDTTPSKASAFGMAKPGDVVGDDFVLSAYNGVSWSETMKILNSNGYIGVGQSTPTSKLDVNGAVRLGAASANNTVNTSAAGGAPTGDLYWGNRILCDNSGNCGGGSGVGGTGTATQLAYWSSGTNIASSSILSLDTANSALNITSAANKNALVITEPYDGGGNSVLGIAMGTSNPKTGIYFKQDSNWSRGSLHFAVNIGADNNPATDSDTRLAISSANGFVGVNTTSPDAPLEVQTTASEKLRLTYTDSSVYGALSVGSGGLLELGSTSGQVQVNGQQNKYSLMATSPYDAGAGGWGGIGIGTTSPKTALIFEQTSNWSRGKLHIAVDGAADGGTAVISDAVATFDLTGNVGIGTTSPTSKFSVGASSQFQVNSNGNIVKINNVTYSWPSSQAASTGYVLTNDASGNLTWAAAGGGGGGAVTGSGTATQVAFWSSATALTSSSNLYWNNTNARLGIGTSNPDNKLVLSGTASDINNGPHVKVITSSDVYPVFQQLNWNHDNIGVSFDAYYDNAWRSSALGSNFQIYKFNNALNFNYASGVAAGSPTTFTTGFTMSSSGNIGIGGTSNAKLGIVNNVMSGTPDAYSEYQLILYDSGGASSSYGLGIEGSHMWFNSNGGYKFYRSGGATPDLWISTAGNVALGGSSAATEKLEVYGGTIRSIKTSSANTTGTGINLTNTSTNGRAFTIFATGSASGVVGSLAIYDDTAGAYRLAMNGSGYLGLNNTNPQTLLDVKSVDNTSTTNIAEFMANNLTVGVGIGYNTVRSVGSNGNNSLFLDAQTGGYVISNKDFGFSSTTGTIRAYNSYNGAYYPVATYVSANYTDNYLQFTSSSGAGSTPAISSIGSATNLNLALNPKGTGELYTSASSWRFNQNTSYIYTTNSYNGAGNYYPAAAFASVGNGNNYIKLVGSSGDGSTPSLTVDGADLNLNLAFNPKGSGNTYIGSGSLYFGNNGSDATPVLGVYDSWGPAWRNVLQLSSNDNSSNYFNFNAVGAGGAPELKAVGGDANVSLNLVPKGTGSLIVSTGVTQYFNGGSDATPYLQVYDDWGPAYRNVVQLSSNNNSSNYFNFNAVGAGGAPELKAVGGDANVSLNLVPKGTGAIMHSTDTLQYYNGGLSDASPYFQVYDTWGPGWRNVLHLTSNDNSSNYLNINAVGSGAGTEIIAEGGDANINLVLKPKGTGGVGIGVNPSYMLDVNGGQTRIGVSTQYSQRLCHSGADVSTAQNVVIGDCSTGGNDFAELYGTSDASVAAADIVSVDPSRTVETFIHPTKGYVSKAWIKKASSSDSMTLVGVVSTNPYSEVLADGIFNANENPRPVALSGRVPVKVNTSNGEIHKGDLISISTTPGVGAKAVQSGFVVGTALQDYSNFDQNAVGIVEVFANLSFYNPQTAANGIIWTVDGNILTTTYSVHINGDLTAQKGTFTSVYTEILNINNGSLTIDGNGKLVTKGAIQSASVVTATLNATDAAIKTLTVEKLNVTEVAVNQNPTAGDATVGTGAIATGQTTVTITNKNITANSLVFVTVTSKGGALLSVTNKVAGTSFDVEIPAPSASNVTFNYWIVSE